MKTKHPSSQTARKILFGLLICCLLVAAKPVFVELLEARLKVDLWLIEKLK